MAVAAAPHFFTTVAQAHAAAAPSGGQVKFASGKGYYVAPKAAPAVQLPGGPNLYATALKLAQQAEEPNIDSIIAQQNRYDTQAATQQENARGFTAALAQMLGSEGPAVSKAYDNAAGATAGFAKGLSDAEAHIAQNENASLSDFLAKQGLSPEQIQAATSKIGGVPASDVTYGLGGYIPAAGLEREGAAFSAAADNQPATIAGEGLQNEAKLATDQANQDFQYGQQLATQRGKVPGEAQTLLNDMLTRLQNQESIDTQRAYLGNSTRNTTSSITGVDPVTGLPKAGYYIDPKTGQVVKDGYVVNPKTGQVVHPPSGSTTPGQKAVTSRENAFASAQKEIFVDAKGLVKSIKNPSPLAGLAGHPATILQKPTYAAAAKELFDKYKYLLRYATRSGQPALKKRLNAIIADALAAQGIAPAKPTRTGTFPTAEAIFTGGGL